MYDAREHRIVIRSPPVANPIARFHLREARIVRSFQLDRSRLVSMDMLNTSMDMLNTMSALGILLHLNPQIILMRPIVGRVA
jgi:hypothetical protein